MKTKSKYRAEKTVIDGIKFDSRVEWKYYEFLKLEKEHWSIESFSMQPKYCLQEKFEKHGIKYRAIYYVADFLVVYLDWKEDVIDIKGMATSEAKMKRKMFEYCFPSLILSWVVYVVKRGGWIWYDENEKAKRADKKLLSQKTKWN